jgi:hypothetical protein
MPLNRKHDFRKSIVREITANDTIAISRFRTMVQAPPDAQVKAIARNLLFYGNNDLRLPVSSISILGP